MAEQDQNGNWTDYIYGNGQKIARVAGAMPVLQMKGHRDPATNYMGCGVSTAIDNIAALSAQLGPIQPGDVFAFDLREPVTDSGITAQGGIGVWTNGAGITTSTTSGLTPWNDTVATGAWQHMVVPIGQAVPGETLTTLDFDMQNGTPAGDYELDYANVVIARANGTIIPVFTGQPVTFSLAGGGGELSANPVTACGATNLTAVVSSLPVDASVGTNYYLDDHLGTTQMELSSGGWPVWQGQFMPFGGELPDGSTAMHYKFTGKERDAESGLDYFGARYYASSMGRWMSPDWSAKAEPVPYSKLGDPQTLNLYGYLTNNPLSRTDPDGHGPLLDKFIAIFYGKASAGPGVGTELKATKYAKVEIGAKAQIEARGTSSGVDVTAKGVVEAKATVGKTTAGVSGEVDKQLVKDGKFDPQPATTTGNIGINPATAGPNEIGVEGHIGAVGLEGGIDVDKVKEFGSAVGDSINSLGQYILNAVTPNPNASPSPPGVSGSNPFNIPLPTPPKQ